MKLEPEILKYLKGENLSTGLTVELSKTKYEIIPREAKIVEIIRNKDVIHVGCSDHIQVINDKIKNNIWLHKLITDNARRCIGIDIDRNSIEYIRKELHYTNVYSGDVLKDPFDIISEKHWDYVVFGEIIEHLDNPVDFLKRFRNRFGNSISRFVITVPGIYNLFHYRKMLDYTETTNSDHRFAFTPYTINKVIVSAGYLPESIFYANLIKLTIPELVFRKIKYILHIPVKYPFYYFKSIIVTGKFY